MLTHGLEHAGGASLQRATAEQLESHCSVPKKVFTQVSSCFTGQKGPSATDIPGLKETLRSVFKNQDFSHIVIIEWSSGPQLSTGPATVSSGCVFRFERRI